VSDIIVIVLILVVVKFFIIGPLLFYVFRDDIRAWRQKPEPLAAPVCMYCESRWTQPVDEGTPRWEGDELVLVTTYECQHCHMPFWRVERVPVSSMPR